MRKVTKERLAIYELCKEVPGFGYACHTNSLVCAVVKEWEFDNRGETREAMLARLVGLMSDKMSLICTEYLELSERIEMFPKKSE
jgi:hypothetical protein